MATSRLTAGRIREIESAKKGAQVFLWDVDAPGLGVRVTAGSKAFIFEGRLEGRRMRITIGDVRVLDIDKARSEARRLQTLIDQGIDPRDQKADQIAAVATKKAETMRQAQAEESTAIRQALLVADGWKVYIEDRRPHWGERHYRDHLNLAQPGGEPKKRGAGLSVPGPLAPLLARRFAEITPEQITAWLIAESATRSTQALLAFGLFKTFAVWCEERSEYRGMIHPDAFAGRSVRDALPSKSAKDDVLQKEQLRAWFAAVRQVGNPVISAYLQTLLLTGARRNEITTLTWANVDFQWGSLTIRDKVDGERTIPMTPYVASLLAGLPRRNEWVFSSPSAAAGHLQEPRIPHNRALATAALPPLTLHGLRRSFGTLSEWVEMPVGIVAQIQGHKPSATAEKHYRRRPLDLLRQWHTKLEGWILEQAGIYQPLEAQAGQPIRRVK
ncbi:tyrosine-type recombinase/integrase [Thiocystis violascens]|uniref:Site-specific recombinase XerD n=1 Tax=Thiocystis violascens (strain ATCC 17096 / DSM 198 / 6111) TaxID=765911 RepID=I3YHE4_THIV6|nr:integrase family protein [Thiocystis violascens]AFL76412.1 site-specific recombinase XerD [Thiocystis violascens DSM 198]